MKAAFLVVDKPVGITSHDVVAMLRAVTGVPKVGHTGTLDPFATGVLPLALGGATRLIQFLDEDLKVYDATIALGVATDTGDPTGTTVQELPVPDLDPEQIGAVLDGFRGVRMQEPPRYSAVKVEGRPLYSYARAGEDVRAKARPVRIDGIELLGLGEDWIRVRIRCGRGTYARVLADEIAQALGTCGHLSALRREQSGPFTEAHLLGLDDLARLATDREGLGWTEVLRPKRGAERIQWRPRSQVWEGLKPWLLSPLQVLAHLPLQPLSRGQREQLLRAGALPPSPAGLSVGASWLAVDGDELLAVVVNEARGPRLACPLWAG